MTTAASKKKLYQFVPTLLSSLLKDEMEETSTEVEVRARKLFKAKRLRFGFAPPTVQQRQHICNPSCVFVSFEDLHVCKASGNYHFCCARFCGSLQETGECQVCTVTGITRKLDIENTFNRWEMENAKKLRDCKRKQPIAGEEAAAGTACTATTTTTTTSASTPMHRAVRTKQQKIIVVRKNGETTEIMNSCEEIFHWAIRLVTKNKVVKNEFSYDIDGNEPLETEQTDRHSNVQVEELWQQVSTLWDEAQKRIKAKQNHSLTSSSQNGNSKKKRKVFFPQSYSFFYHCLIVFKHAITGYPSVVKKNEWATKYIKPVQKNGFFPVKVYTAAEKTFRFIFPGYRLNR